MPIRRFRTTLLAAFLILASPQIMAQEAGLAPPNPWAANSPWPHFHRNSYAQAATPLRGPEPADRSEVQYVALPQGAGGAPTQMHLSELYPDGSRTAWSTTLNSIIKVRVRGDAFELVDVHRISRGPISVHWNMQLARGNRAFVPDPRRRAIIRFADTNPRDPRSPIREEARWTLPQEIQGTATVINMTYDGWIVFVTDRAWVGAVRQDFSAWRSFNLAGATNDLTVHNSFPIDENGNMFVVSHQAMTSVRWTGDGFVLNWRTPYDFRGAGCPPPSESRVREVVRVFRGERCTGSGTTPTLVGRGAMDRLVVAVDSHAPNNLVAFWRDDIPADWRGLPGRDRRVAGVLRLPHSTWVGDGFTAENSPAAWGYDIAVAQFAGFRPDCDAPRGVQLARWDPNARRLTLAWTNPNVMLNGVLTISGGSRLVYGSGLGDDCRAVYRGLDLATGRLMFSIPMGGRDQFLDQGNSNVVNDDRSIIFGVPSGVARIRLINRD